MLVLATAGGEALGDLPSESTVPCDVLIGGECGAAIFIPVPGKPSGCDCSDALKNLSGLPDRGD